MTETIRYLASGGTGAVIVLLILAVVWFARRDITRDAREEALRAEVKDAMTRAVAAAQTERDQRLADAKGAYKELGTHHGALVAALERNTAALEASAERDSEVVKALALVEATLLRTKR